MPASGFVELNGVSLAYQVTASAVDAPWLVFSNSLLTSNQIWDDQVAALESRFRVLRYDQRGHGRSSVSGEPVTIELLATDLAGLIEHFKIEKCSLIGLSMGVPTVLCYYSRQPEKVQRLVLSDGQTRTAPGGRETWQERIEQANDLGMEQFAPTVAHRWFSPEFRQSPRGKEALAMIASTPLDGFVAGATALQDYDFERVLPTISVPVQLIAGERDGKMPENMQTMCHSIPDARFSAVPEAGHIPNLENPRAFTQTLEAFLSGTSGH